MAIIAGFKCVEGIVICSDIAEMGSKRHGPTLRREPSGAQYRTQALFGEGGEGDLAVAFCGAADDRQYLDMLVDEAWEAARRGSSLADASALIKQSIKNTYQEYGSIYQGGLCPKAELVYGLKMGRSSKLFYSNGPAVTEKATYVSGGADCHIADLLASRMYDTGLNIRQCVVLAAYVLSQSRGQSNGVGDDSHVVVLRNEGSGGLVKWAIVESMTRLLKESERALGEIMIRLVDLGVTEEEFRMHSAEAVESLASTREGERRHLQEDKEAWSALASASPHNNSGPAGFIEECGSQGNRSNESRYSFSRLREHI